ncbi:energy transducer TonB [Pseudomonas abieticivorans]|uniref:energy transducer TonB n=1 Tax=Pseudomonas abieticivorans TaxID=2931382 RepID=UPI0020BE92B4|nr:energy transducer TonB [Pseudomonas sp. PIA16]
MSNILPTSPSYISPSSDFGLRNSQALGGVSHLWQDFFAQALAEQQSDGTDSSYSALPQDPASEPTGGTDLLAQIHSQRLCDVQDTEIAPPEPLFLPKAEFEMELLDKPFPPYETDEIVAQDQHLAFDSRWVRPIVLSAGQPLPDPGPAPTPAPLHLPIAEFEWDLTKPTVPFDATTLAEQNKAFEFDAGWARPIVLQNMRMAA